MHTPTAVRRDLSHKDPQDLLFRHVSRPEWGIGLWVEEEKNRRRLHFQDGQERAIRRGWYDQLRPVDPAKVDVDEVHAELAGEHRLAAKARALAGDAADQPAAMRFSDQVALFTAMYPDGFADPTYLAEHRRPAEGAHDRKSHVDLSMALAREALTAARMDAMLADGEDDALFADVVAVLSSTTLVTRARAVAPLQALDADQRRALLLALRDLLHGDAPPRDRFAAWLQALRADCGLTVRWPLATVLPALSAPETHATVKHGLFELQARSVIPGLRLRKQPGAGSLRRAHRLLRAVESRLADAGLHPQDLHDVRNFMWQTLRPRALAMHRAKAPPTLAT